MGCFTLLICVVIVLLSRSQLFLAFNLDAEFPILFSPFQPDQSFGYSVDYYGDSTEAWIIVGAPGDTSNGRVFKCRYDSASSSSTRNCDVINISAAQSASNNARLGSTVALGRNKQLVACAPLFTSTKVQSQSSAALDYLITGICYITEDFTQQNSLFYLYLPCTGEHKSQLNTGERNSFCQLGNSVAFTTDKRKILLGAVGSSYGQGSLMLIQGDLSRNISSLPIHTQEFEPTVPPNVNELDYLRETYDSNYMGYSVATGSTTGERTIIVTSAPRRFGQDLLGAVIIYDESLTTVLKTFTGKQMGEYFGHGLAVVDVNGDNLDDIIVGSPLYSNYARNQPELGRIYIFHQLKSNTPAVEFSNSTIISGSSTMGRFGSTITSLGDVNDDGYTDIMVSAPYERSDSKVAYGAVYVFNGGRDGLHRRPSQVIYGKNLEKSHNGPNKIRGLGFSAKGGQDMDNNDYPDLVLGAYLSDQVVLLRARPVVKLHISSNPTPSIVSWKVGSIQTPFSLNEYNEVRLHSCFSYSGKKLPSSLKISYSYDVDSKKPIGKKRSFGLDSSIRTLTLIGSGSQCLDEKFNVTTQFQDKLSPILVKISYWIPEKHQPLYPILDATSGHFFTTQVDISKNCGADNICTPDLQLLSFAKQRNSDKQVILSSTINNLNENAYEVLLVVEYPNSTTVVSERTGNYFNCWNANHLLTCDVGNPLGTNGKVTIDLVFDLIVLQNVNDLEFKIWTVYERIYKSSTKSVKFNIDIQTKKKADIFPVSIPEFILLQTPKKNGDTVSVTHVYEITNMGSFKMQTATAYISWPLVRQHDADLFSLDDVVTSGPVSCQDVSSFSNIDIINSLRSSKTKIADGIYDANLNTNLVFNCKSGSCRYLVCNVEGLKPRSGVQIKLSGTLSLDYFRQERAGAVTSDLLFETQHQAVLSGDLSRNHQLFEITSYIVEPLTIATSASDGNDIYPFLVIFYGAIISVISIACGVMKIPRHTSDFSSLLDQTLYGEDATNMFNLKL